MNNLIYDLEVVKLSHKNQSIFVFLGVFYMDNKFLIAYKCDLENENFDIDPYKNQILNQIMTVNKDITDQTFVWLDLNEPQNIDILAMTIGIDNSQYRLPNDFEEFNLAYNGEGIIIPTIDKTFYSKDFDFQNNCFKNRYFVDTILTNKKTYWLTDFNGTQYDLTILALFFNDTLNISGGLDRFGRKTITIAPISAEKIYAYNKEMFSRYRGNMPQMLNHFPTAKAIRQNILNSGKHIDIPKLSGASSFLSLKEQAGNLGYQIIENANVKGENNNKDLDLIGQLINLFAYCVSDVIVTNKLLHHSFYHGNIDIGLELIKDYPQLTYDYKIVNNKKVPDLTKPRKKLPSLDDTSANKAATILAPYDKLKDYKYISFMYPSEEQAVAHNIKRFNVLEYMKEFFYSNITDPIARTEFDKVYSMYKGLEGLNVNMSESYIANYGIQPISSLTGKKVTIPLFDKQGNVLPISLTMSIGGAHGCIINLPRNLSKEEQIKIINTLDDSNSKKTKYKYTFMGNCIHCDFSSYYPILLVMMSVFKSSSDADEYYEIYKKKEYFGELIKKFKKENDINNVKLYTVKRSGTKQNLNAPTGKACPKVDESKFNNIQMNNAIVSMRSIGQMFTFILSQMQALNGGLPVSINTDGVYTAFIDPKVNDSILEFIHNLTGVTIEPEDVILVSKDSNCRCEFTPDLNIKEAKSSLGNYDGPLINKSATKPAIISNLLIEYFRLMIKNNINIDQPLNIDLMKYLLQNVYFTKKDGSEDLGKKLLMFARIVKASNSSYTFPVLTPCDDDKYITDDNIIPLSHYSRVFLTKKGYSNNHIVNLEMKTISKTSAKKREKNGEKAIQHNELVKKTMMDIINALSLPVPNDKEVCISKVSNIEQTNYVSIINDDLHLMEESKQRELLDNLDLDAYLNLIISEYNNIWLNQITL